MHGLDLAERVLDQVLGEGRSDAGEKQEGGLQGVVGADKNLRIAAPVPGGVAVPPAVVPREVLKVRLLLDELEAGEENAVAEALLQEAQAVPCEHAPRTDLAQLVSSVRPHGLVLAFEHLRDLEPHAEGVEGSSHDRLDGAGCEAGGEGAGQRWWRVDAFRVLGRGGVEGGEGGEVGCVEDSADGGVCYQRWEDWEWSVSSAGSSAVAAMGNRYLGSG